MPQSVEDEGCAVSDVLFVEVYSLAGETLTLTFGPAGADGAGAVLEGEARKAPREEGHLLCAAGQRLVALQRKGCGEPRGGCACPLPFREVWQTVLVWWLASGPTRSRKIMMREIDVVNNFFKKCERAAIWRGGVNKLCVSMVIAVSRPPAGQSCIFDPRLQKFYGSAKKELEEGKMMEPEFTLDNGENKVSYAMLC